MNQTATPLTDALVAIINPMIDSPSFDNVTASYVRDAVGLSRRLERHNAELIAALESLDLATVRIGSFVPDNERNSLIYAQDKARSILKRVQS